MMTVAEGFMVLAASMSLLMIICLARIARGPTTPDRVVALDNMNTLVVAAMIVLGAVFQEVMYIDIAIIYAMLSFVSTLYIAKYIEDKGDGNKGTGKAVKGAGAKPGRKKA